MLQEVDEAMRAEPEYGQDMLEPIEILGLDRFADLARGAGAAACGAGDTAPRSSAGLSSVIIMTSDKSEYEETVA